MGVVQVAEIDAALELSAQVCPDIAVLDLEPDSPTLAASIARFRAYCPHTKLLALVESEKDRQLAISCGVDVVAFEGVSGEKLSFMIQALSDEYRA